MGNKKGDKPVAIGTSRSNSNTGVTTTTITPTRYSLAGVGSNLSKAEAQGIANNRGTTVGKIMDKAMGKGLTIGSGLVNAYNSGKYTSAKDNIWKSLAPQFGADNARKLFGVSDNMSGLSGLKLNPGQVYGGSYMRNGELTPLVSMKIGGGKNSSTGTTSQTTTTGPATATPGNSYSPSELTPTAIDPVAPQQPIANTIDSSFSPGGAGAMLDGSATSIRKNKSKARTAGLTTKGTSQFKISGQTSSSSGVNTGI